MCVLRERVCVCVCVLRERESEYFTWSYKIKKTTIHGLQRVQYKSEGVWNTHSKQYIILYTYIKPSYYKTKLLTTQCHVAPANGHSSGPQAHSRRPPAAISKKIQYKINQ